MNWTSEIQNKFDHTSDMLKDVEGLKITDVYRCHVQRSVNWQLVSGNLDERAKRDLYLVNREDVLF